MPRNPLWSAIAATLSAEIAAGRYAPGDRLPAESQLAARFGVNRHTLRRAVAAMAEAGLVQTRQGAGVFVAAGRRLDYPLGTRVRFHATLAAQGASPSRSVTTVETRRADQAEAMALGLGTGAAVHVAEGISYADGVPLALFRSVFPAARLPGMPEALREAGSVTEALRRAGVTDYTRATTLIDAQTADATQALRLRIAEGAALLRTTGVNVDPEAAAVEYGQTWFAAERVTLRVGDV